MDLIDILGFVFIFFFLILSLIISGYILLAYTHPLEKEFTGRFVSKILIIWGITLCFFILIGMILDLLANYKK